jgi:hypothetical protein
MALVPHLWHLVSANREEQACPRGGGRQSERASVAQAFGDRDKDLGAPLDALRWKALCYAASHIGAAHVAAQFQRGAGVMQQSSLYRQQTTRRTRTGS